MTTTAEAAPVLECTDLVRRFGERTAVDHVSFTVGPGETYGLLGPNGARKSTTIKLVCGLLAAHGGTVHVAGRPIDERSTHAKAAIGYVPQDIALYPDLTAAENLRFFGSLYELRGAGLRRRVDEVLELIGLADRADD
ncbi:MAG: ATP-binding cassette domain-containing protein, partial [Actinomycetota bacterium]